MTERTLAPFLEGGGFFECPRWRDGGWWVSDFYREAVYTVTADGREELVLEVEHQPSGLGWLPDGSLLVVSMKDQRVLRRDPDGDVSTHADLGAFTDTSLNDMVVDGRGRAWVGCFGFDLMAFADPQLAPLMRIDPDGTATIAAEELTFPNGSVITPDGNTLIVGETAGCRYTAFRIAPGGAIVEEIPTPEGLGCYACALGGDDGRTLLVCAAPDFLEANRRQAREAVLLTATVDVPHAGLP